MERAGVGTPAGLPLSPYARELLEAFENVFTQFEGWAAEGRRILAKVRAIGTGV